MKLTVERKCLLSGDDDGLICMMISCVIYSFLGTPNNSLLAVLFNCSTGGVSSEGFREP